MFKQGDSQINRNERLLFLTNFTAKCGWIFILTQENACSQRFQFKTNRKNIGSSKNCTMDFCISPPFRRSTYFYLAITEILKVFNALTLKPVFSKPKTFFIKLDYRFLVQCATIKNLPWQKQILRQIEWGVQGGTITNNGVLPLTTLVFWKFNSNIRTSYK